MKAYWVFTQVSARIPYLDSLLPGERVRLSPLKPSRASQCYRRLGSPQRAKTCCAGEAAGLPSFALKMVYPFVGLSVQDCPFPLLLIILAFYYDASAPSTLEHWHSRNGRLLAAEA
jgi:capsular polysaccharide export protein